MNEHRMDQETAERLLVGTLTEAQDGPQVLVGFLAAVRAAPRPHELTGEGAALQAFRVARAGGAVPVAVSRPPRRLHAGLFGAKVALAALLATVTGGVALAAVTGNLPVPPGRGGGASLTPSPHPSTDGRATPTVDPGRATTPAAPPTGRPGSPAALAGLCTVYRAKNDADRGRALEAPPFAELVAAAGGREKVPGYCDALLTGHGKPTGSHGTPPQPSAVPTTRPGVGPTARVTGQPEATPGTPEVRLATTTPPAKPPASKTASVRPSRR
ncbi:hypothetical protein [Micromonospora sp. MA102]|uniref:hypothetical protein n=1 Tax=Micromonospora sp. MA102 TaxID=2952755 RepID=UPI0021C98341|nr:hypothetical protein [Micromonospora sp. MA102]